MTVKECYDAMGGDYSEIMDLLQSESRVKKYLTKFSEDRTMEQLTEALKLKKYDDAFRYVHTLKGVSINLGMKKLAESSHLLTEALRNGEDSVNDLYHNVKEDYYKTMEAIQQLLQNV